MFLRTLHNKPNYVFQAFKPNPISLCIIAVCYRYTGQTRSQRSNLVSMIFHLSNTAVTTIIAERREFSIVRVLLL